MPTPYVITRALRWLLLVLPVAAVSGVAQTALLPVRVALIEIGDAQTAGDAISLAETELSGRDGILVVERQRVERLLKERELWHAGGSEARQAVASGKVLGVDLFVAIETFGALESGTGLVAFDALTGLRLWDAALDSNAPREMAQEIVSLTISALQKRQGGDHGVTSVCLFSVRNTGLPREMNSACEAAGRILERRLLASPGVAVLERRRLDQINAERNLPGSGAGDALRSSLLLIEVEIGRLPEGRGLAGTIYLTDATGAAIGRVDAEVAGFSPLAAVEALIPELLRRLQAAPPARRDREDEARRFAKESKFLMGDGDVPGGLRAAEAAAALDPEAQDVQIQLAWCLANRALEILAPTFQSNGEPIRMHRQSLQELRKEGRNNVAGSLPFASRALDLCRAARLRAQEQTLPPDPKLLDVENCLTAASPVHHERTYWERLLQLYQFEEPETQGEIRSFQIRLREVRTRMHVDSLRSRAVDLETTRAYASQVDRALHNAEKFVANSSDWTADIAWIMSGWLEVFDAHALSWGGWVQTFTRTLARLTCQAAGNDVQGFNPAKSVFFGDVPRINGWQLQDQDLAGFRALFQRMSLHSDPIVQCYGRIGQLALILRGQERVSPEALREYETARDWIRARIANPGREPLITYHRHAYSAARDLIDLLPDPELRRREHLDLFEFSMQRREIAFWTVWMVSSPNACRYAHYHPWPAPFPIDSAGYDAGDSPFLLANARRAVELYASEDRTDVDGLMFSYVRGSFEREMGAIMASIHAPQPGIAASGDAPWAGARTLFELPDANARRIGTVLADGTNAYAVVINSRGPPPLEVFRIPLDGGPAINLGHPPGGVVHHAALVNLRTCVDRGSVYMATPHGVLQFSPGGGNARLIDQSAGLLSSEVGAFTVADGKLYAMLREGHLVALDLESGQCDILASKRSREVRSPLDELAGGFDVATMIHDAPRGRILFATRFAEFPNCFPLLGLWQIDIRTGKITQLVEMLRSIRWMALHSPDELILSWSDYDETRCRSVRFGAMSFDLAADRGRLLWLSDDRPIGPEISADARTIKTFLISGPPFLLQDDWLWMVSRGHGRLSLSSGKFEDFAPPQPARSSGRFEWHTLRRVDERHVIAADGSRVWLLSFDEGNPKDSDAALVE